MGVIYSQNGNIVMLITQIEADFPQFSFKENADAHWSFVTKTIFFVANESEEVAWTLLHELGHALLDHSSYGSDIELLQKEAAAWFKARELAERYKVPLKEEYIEDCLDTYRDWLHKRSSCPECGLQGVQHSKALYYCFNCQARWKVTDQRFCRPYRLKKR